VGVAFLSSLTAVSMLAKPYHFGVNDQQHYAKTFLYPQNLNAVTGITSYHCVNLDIAILHGAIKRIQNWVFAVSF